jgi:predicted nucleic acid-binding protein
MHKAVLDTTVLASGFLKPVAGGVAHELLRLAERKVFVQYISPSIIEELAEALLRPSRNRRRYKYDDAAVADFCDGLKRFATLVTNGAKVRVCSRS